jgi:hypothetical protein
MTNILINKEIKGTLKGDYGYYEIASTPERPLLVSTLEKNSGQNLLSPNYASLFAFKTEGKKSLSIVHIQGQHEGDPGRMYDTRNFYNIDAEELRKCNSKIGAIVSSLPRMEKYSNKKIGTLSNELQVGDIQGFDETIANNLYEYLMRAIVECKYLLIKLDDKSNWKENGVLENTEAKTLFTAIDKLPEILRPVASFALSVDEKYEKDFLKDFLVILYHGNNNFGFKSTIEINNWEQLKSKPKTNYSSYVKFYTDLALLVKQNGKDLFDTDLSAMEMLMNICDKGKEPNVKNTVEYLEIQSDWRKLLTYSNYPISQKMDIIEYKLSEEQYNDFREQINTILTSEIQTKIQKPVFDLSDTYRVFKYHGQDQIREKYVELYCQEKSSLPVGKQIETVKDIIDRKNIEKDLQNQIVNKLTLQILKEKLKVKEWREVADLVSSSNLEQQFIEETAKRDLSFFKELLKVDTHKEIIEQSFKQTFAYKNNSEELCKKPFITHLEPEKIKELREKYLDSFDDFPDLFKNITITEILELLKSTNNEQTIIKLVNTTKLGGEFIDNQKELCEQEFSKAMYKPDIKKSEIYKLYTAVNVRHPKPEIELRLDNLNVVCNNAKDLGFNLQSEVAILYKLNSNVTDWRFIYKITKLKPAENEKIEKAVDTIQKLDDCIVLKKAGFVLPEIDAERLIKCIKPEQKRKDNSQMDDLLSKLKQLEIPFNQYKNEVEQRLSKTNGKLLEKYFAKENDGKGDSGTDTTDNHNNGKFLTFVKKGGKFLKTQWIGFVIGFVVACIIDSDTKNKTSDANQVTSQENSNQTKATSNTDKQSVAIPEPLKNDTIYLNYCKGEGADDKFKISDSTIKVFRLDSIRYENLRDSAKNNLLLKDFYPVKFISVTFENTTTLLEFQVDGGNSNKQFFQKLDSVITKQK